MKKRYPLVKPIPQDQSRIPQVQLCACGDSAPFGHPGGVWTCGMRGCRREVVGG